MTDPAPNHEGAYISTVANQLGLPEDDFVATPDSTPSNPVITHYVPRDRLDAASDLADLLNFEITVIEEYDQEVMVKVTKTVAAFD